MVTQEMARIANTYMIFAVIWYVTHTLGMRHIFEMAKVSNKAIAYIPVYREVKLFQIVWDKKNMGLYWAISSIVGVVCYVMGARLAIQPLGWVGLLSLLFATWLWLRKCHFEARAFNRKNGTAIGLMLFNILFTLYVGYSKTEYKGAKK